MAMLFTCSCAKKLQVRDELAGKLVRCPDCGATHRIAADGDADRQAGDRATAVAPRAASRVKPPPFPILGVCIGVAAIILGCAMIAGGLVVTVNINRSPGEFKPGGLIVFAFPGLLWILCGGLLLALRWRFVIPFCVFLAINWLVGVLFTTQSRSLGGPADARIFAMIGLGFLLGGMFFQLFHGFLMRDLRRQAAASRDALGMEAPHEPLACMAPPAHR